MAAFLNDPLVLSLTGVNANTIIMWADHLATGEHHDIYDGTAGGWQAPFNGNLIGGGSGGIIVQVLTIPATLTEGLWRVTVAAEAYCGATGGGSWKFWLLVFAVDEGDQSTLNSVDVAFTWEPKHIDPNDPADGVNLDNYVITGPVAPLAARLLQAVVYWETNTLRLFFDGPLVPGEIYAIQISNVEAAGGSGPLTPDPTSFSFTAFGAMAEPVPLEAHPSQRWDLRNPQAHRDAPEGHPLGTFVIDDEGDLDVETRREYLRKRIFRRLTTPKGSILSLPTYGLDYAPKQRQTPARLRKLQQDAEAQIKQERGVKRVRVAVAQDATDPGIVVMTVRVVDEFGELTETIPIGGDE